MILRLLPCMETINQAPPSCSWHLSTSSYAEQHPPYHIEGGLRRLELHLGAFAEEPERAHAPCGRRGRSDDDRANRLLGSAARGSSDAGDADADICGGARPDA